MHDLKYKSNSYYFLLNLQYYIVVVSNVVYA